MSEGHDDCKNCGTKTDQSDTTIMKPAINRERGNRDTCAMLALVPIGVISLALNPAPDPSPSPSQSCSGSRRIATA